MQTKYSITGQPQITVYVVNDHYYVTRGEAQAAVDLICNAGYGIFPIEEYEIDRPLYPIEYWKGPQKR